MWLDLKFEIGFFLNKIPELYVVKRARGEIELVEAEFSALDG